MYIGGRWMYRTTCIICRKEFVIHVSDRRYKDIKYGREVKFICDQCSMSTRHDAAKAAGVSQESVEKASIKKSNTK